MAEEFDAFLIPEFHDNADLTKHHIGTSFNYDPKDTYRFLANEVLAALGQGPQYYPSIWFARNLTLLENHHPELMDLCFGNLRGDLVAEDARNGRTTLLYRNNGAVLSLHSRFNPDQEAVKLAETVKSGSDEILVILGMGLAYHIEAVLGRVPLDKSIVIIEADGDVFRSAMRYVDLSNVLARPHLHFIIGNSSEETLKQITRLQIAESFSNLSLMEHPPSTRSNPEFYGELKQEILKASSSPLRESILYPKLNKEQLNILLLNSGYFLMREIAAGAQSLGHRVHMLPVRKKGYSSRETIRNILESVSYFKPDFVLTINHMGFDADGIMSDLLSRMRLPLASWFVDSPLLIMGGQTPNVSDYSSIFLWDRDYVDELEAMGFANVHYLPLATDPDIFKPLKRKPGPLGALSNSVSFVGDSMVFAIEQTRSELNLASGIEAYLNHAAFDFMNSKDRTPEKAIERSGLGNVSLLSGDDLKKSLPAARAVMWKATQYYRLLVIKALAGLHPTIVGDEGWRKVIDVDKYKFVAPLKYYDELPYFYPISDVNMNITSMQMKTGLNQRVFDVPACGAFLLTDRRDQIADMFDIGREIACYEDPEEAADLARYYSRRESERLKIVDRGRKRILAEHTYRRRMAKMIEIIKSDHL